MPVFESRASDIYEPDQSEDPFGMTAIPDRHQLLVSVRNPLAAFAYLLLSLPTEGLIDVFPGFQVLRMSFTNWTRAFTLAPLPPVDPIPREEIEVSEEVPPVSPTLPSLESISVDPDSADPNDPKVIAVPDSSQGSETSGEFDYIE
jgi:hypothetical protein